GKDHEYAIRPKMIDLVAPVKTIVGSGRMRERADKEYQSAKENSGQNKSCKGISTVSHGGICCRVNFWGTVVELRLMLRRCKSWCHSSGGWNPSMIKCTATVHLMDPGLRRDELC